MSMGSFLDLSLIDTSTVLEGVERRERVNIHPEVGVDTGKPVECLTPIKYLTFDGMREISNFFEKPMAKIETSTSIDFDWCRTPFLGIKISSM
jgi:hypothetical protein